MNRDRWRYFQTDGVRGSWDMERNSSLVLPNQCNIMQPTIGIYGVVSQAILCTIPCKYPFTCYSMKCLFEWCCLHVPETGNPCCLARRNTRTPKQNQWRCRSKLKSDRCTVFYIFPSVVVVVVVEETCLPQLWVSFVTFMQMNHWFCFPFSCIQWRCAASDCICCSWGWQNIRIIAIQGSRWACWPDA